MSNLDVSLASNICWHWVSWGKTSQASFSFVFVIQLTSEKLTRLSFSLSLSNKGTCVGIFGSQPVLAS